MIARMRRVRLLGLLGLAVLGPAPAAADIVPPPSPETRHAWGFDRTELSPDPAVRFGVLANGMRYAIMHNGNPAHLVAMRLRIAAGSVDEDEDAHGAAHFVEHLAFLGSHHVPEGSLTPLLERSGLASGPDVNAHTSYCDTVYRLDLPRAEDGLIDTGLMLMRETASELTLSDSAIARARPVILDELRVADDVDQRLATDQARFFTPGAPTARPVIGSEQEVGQLSAEALRHFYARFYTPERATLVIVGDVDPIAIEARLAARFGDWRSAGGPAEARPPAQVDPDRPTAAHLFVNPFAPTAVAIASVGPLDPRPDSAVKRDRQYYDYLASTIFNRRLARLARAHGARFLTASSGIYDYRRTAHVAELDLTALGEDWRTALAAGEQELRRAILFGFSQAELDEQQRAERQTFAAQTENRRSGAIADTITGMIEAGVVFTALPDQVQSGTYVARRRLADVNAAFHAAWSRPGRLIHVSTTAPVAGDETAIAEAWAASGRTRIEPPDRMRVRAFAYGNFGPPGRVAEDGRIADLGIRTLRFANNVRLNIRHTDFDPGRVQLSVRVGGGALDFPQVPDGLANFMGTAFAAGGTVAHSQDELQSIMAGRAVSGGFEVMNDAFGGTRATTADDLEAQLQLFAAFLVAPGYRPEGESLWQTSLASWYPTLDNGPQGVVTRAVERLVASGDTRFGVGPQAELRRLDFAALRPLVAPILAHAPIEIGIVGDVDEQQAIAAVARTFGALPPREPVRAPDPSPAPHFPADRATITLTHQGASDDAMVAVYWPTTGISDDREAARLDLLRAVLWISARDRIREELGATYTPLIGLSRWPGWPDYGFLSLRCTVAPDKADRVLAAIDAIAAQLAAAPPGADLIERARNPLLEHLDREARENATWVRLVGVAQSRPDALARFRDQTAMLRAVTGEELRDTARRYLRADAALRFRILPRSGT